MLESDALRRIEEIRLKYTKPSDHEFEDDIDYMIKQRIKKESYREQRNSELRSKMEYDRNHRHIYGSTEWTEKKTS